MLRILPWTIISLVILLLYPAGVRYARVSHARTLTRLERDSASQVVGGLQIRVKEMTRVGDAVQMTYVFAWVGEPDFLFMRYSDRFSDSVAPNPTSVPWVSFRSAR
jgi:hypothetical protein